MENTQMKKIVNIGGTTNSPQSMNIAQMKQIAPVEVSKELSDVLEYFETIETILDDTYRALGETRIVEISTSIASNNMKIDVKSFGSIPPSEVSPRLA